MPEVLLPLAAAAEEQQQKKVVQKPVDYQAIMLKESPREVVRKRLQWMVDHAAEGQMPVGEAICGVTGNFVPSSTPNIYEYAGVYIWVRAATRPCHLPLSRGALTLRFPPRSTCRPYSWSRACVGCPTPSDGPSSSPVASQHHRSTPPIYFVLRTAKAFDPPGPCDPRSFGCTDN